MIRAHIMSFQELFNFLESYEALEKNNLEVDIYIKIPELSPLSKRLILKVGRIFKDWTTYHLELNDNDGDDYMNVKFEFPSDSIERKPERNFNNIETIIVRNYRLKIEDTFEKKDILVSKSE